MPFSFIAGSCPKVFRARGRCGIDSCCGCVYFPRLESCFGHCANDVICAGGILRGIAGAEGFSSLGATSILVV